MGHDQIVASATHGCAAAKVGLQFFARGAATRETLHITFSYPPPGAWSLTTSGPGGHFGWFWAQMPPHCLPAMPMHIKTCRR